MKKFLLITAFCGLSACGGEPAHFAVVTSTLQEDYSGELYRDYDILEDRLTESECLLLVAKHSEAMLLFARTQAVADMGCYDVGMH